MTTDLSFFSANDIPFFSAILTFLIVKYLICVFPVYRMAVTAGIEDSWIAFIPIVNGYLIFKLASMSGWLFLLGPVPMVGLVLYIVAYYRIGINFKLGAGGGVLSVFFSLIVWWVIVVTNKEYEDHYKTE